jgi:damage-control phosphatase, subfamily I
METRIECFPCFLRQVVIALKQVCPLPGLQEEIMLGALSILQAADMNRTPAHTGTLMHRMIRERLGADPFDKVKKEYNEIAMVMYPALKGRVSISKDPLWTAARLAIAGNIIDFGIFTSVDINHSIENALKDAIAVDQYDSFSEAIEEADNVLYLLDNAGEIVFDRLLIEELIHKGKRVRAVVKGSPVLNDATMDDARQIKLTEICDVLDNGSDAIGTVLEWTSPEFQTNFHSADLIISKGQGNFETISGNGKSGYFLFQAKCDVISNDLGLSPGSMILKKF